MRHIFIQGYRVLSVTFVSLGEFSLLYSLVCLLQYVSTHDGSVIIIILEVL